LGDATFSGLLLGKACLQFQTGFHQSLGWRQKLLGHRNVDILSVGNPLRQAVDDDPQVTDPGKKRLKKFLRPSAVSIWGD